MCNKTTPEWEYSVTDEDGFASQTFESRHEAVGFAAIISRYKEYSADVVARQSIRDDGDLTKDALWRARILDKSGEEWTHVGWTLLYDTRSFAADSAYIYMMMNHLDEASVSTQPWYGDEYQHVGDMVDDNNEFPMYIGYSDGEPLEHDANALQYRQHITPLGYHRVDDD